MKHNIQKTIELIPAEVLLDVFLKKQDPQSILMKEMKKVLDLLFKSWVKNMGSEEMDENIFGNKQEDFRTERIALNINFGYKKGQLDLIGDKIYEYYAWDGNLNDIAEKYLFFTENGAKTYQMPMQLQLIQIDNYDKKTRFNELLSDYPFFEYYKDIFSDKERLITVSKMRFDDADNKINDFFQNEKYNHISKFLLNCEMQIKEFNFKFALHFWIIGPLDNSMNLVNEYFNRNDINNYSDFFMYLHGLKQ